MVRGLDIFARHFESFQDRYVLIGGAAAFVAMDAAALDFRATKDLDIVLCVETLDVGFTRAFWEFVKAGGYQVGQRSSGSPTYYRFLDPENADYPHMLELFSRSPGLIVPPSGDRLVRIPVSDEVSSLSAILLDDDYYQLVLQGRVEHEGLSVLAPAYVILLKARAWIDLTARREGGEPVARGDVKKHRNDVLRLSQLISPDERVVEPHVVQRDLTVFSERALQDGAIPKDLGIPLLTLQDVRSLLTTVFMVAP